MVAAIPRTAWQDPSAPVVGPPRKLQFAQGVIHYEGANRDRTPADIAAHLRNMQAEYLRVRGYSLGYGYAVVSDVRHPNDGTRWEIRGVDLNMASNPGRKWADDDMQPEGNANDWTGSVLLIGPTGVRASTLAAQAVRELFGEWHATAGSTPVRPIPHKTLDYTDCCGAPYLADIAAGLFDPSAPTPTDEVDMIALDYKPNTPQWTALTYTGTHLAHVSDGHADSVIRRAGVQRVTISDKELDGLIESATTTTDAPKEFSPSRKAAWNAAKG